MFCIWSWDKAAAQAIAIETGTIPKSDVVETIELADLSIAAREQIFRCPFGDDIRCRRVSGDRPSVSNLEHVEIDVTFTEKEIGKPIRDSLLRKVELIASRALSSDEWIERDAHNKALRELEELRKTEQRRIDEQLRRDRENERKVAAEKAEAERIEKKRVEQEEERKYREERESWVRVHGSTRLRKALELEILDTCDRVYLEERLAIELGKDWRFDGEDFDYIEARNPEETSIEELAKVIKHDYLSEAGLWTIKDKSTRHDSDYDYQPRRFLAVCGKWFGRDVHKVLEER
jgi:hypothetical protein